MGATFSTGYILQHFIKIQTENHNILFIGSPSAILKLKASYGNSHQLRSVLAIFIIHLIKIAHHAMIRNNLETRLATMLKNSMMSQVLNNHRNVGNQKMQKPVIVANRLQYVYDGYTRLVGSN